MVSEASPLMLAAGGLASLLGPGSMQQASPFRLTGTSMTPIDFKPMMIAGSGIQAPGVTAPRALQGLASLFPETRRAQEDQG